MLVISVVRNGSALLSASGEDEAHLLYPPAYRKGDSVVIATDHAGFYTVCLEDTVPPSRVYMKKGKAVFPIPFGVMRAGFSPRAFTGKRHFLWVREADETTGPVSLWYGEAGASEKQGTILRNLAYNPLDGNDNVNIYPHASTNVRYADSLRNKIFPDKGLFAARCAIDGFAWNESHRLYPYQSFGVNRMEDAYLDIDFGRAVNISFVRLWLRCEFPHDTCWKSAKLSCRHADGTQAEHALSFKKTEAPQTFTLEEKDVISIRLTHMTMPDEPGFAALTEIGVYGEEHRASAPQTSDETC